MKLIHPDQLDAIRKENGIKDSLCFLCGEPTTGDHLVNYSMNRYSFDTKSYFVKRHAKRFVHIKCAEGYQL